MKKLATILFMLLLAGSVKAQILKPVKWSYAVKKLSASEAIIYLKATMEPGWHIYADSKKAGAPTKTSFNFKADAGYNLVGKLAEPKPIVKYEAVMGMSLAYFEQEAVFSQKIRINKKDLKSVAVTVEFMTCNDQKCLPPDETELTVALPK